MRIKQNVLYFCNPPSFENYVCPNLLEENKLGFSRTLPCSTLSGILFMCRVRIVMKRLSCLSPSPTSVLVTQMPALVTLNISPPRETQHFTGERLNSIF